MTQSAALAEAAASTRYQELEAAVSRARQLVLHTESADQSRHLALEAKLAAAQEDAVQARKGIVKAENAAKSQCEQLEDSLKASQAQAIEVTHQAARAQATAESQQLELERALVRVRRGAEHS